MCLLCEIHGRGTIIHDKEEVRQYEHAVRVVEAEKAGLTLLQYMRGKKRWGSLHGHSEFSLLDGAARVKDLILKAKNMGQDFVAITDHGNMFGAVKAHKYAKEQGIKHIVGSEFYVTPRGKSRFDKTFKKGEKAFYHMVILAKNKIGYQNLCRLSSIGWEEGFYRQPRIDRDVLEQYKEGLIVTSTCIGATIPQAALKGDFYTADAEMEFMMETFGNDFYVEIQNHGIEDEKIGFGYMRELAKKYNTPTIITTDSHYLDEEDMVTHDALLCIGTGQWVDQPNRAFQFEGTGYHYMGEEEVIKVFPNDIDSIYRSGEIADKCDDEVIPMGEVQLPYFNVPTADEEFDRWRAEKCELSWLAVTDDTTTGGDE